MVEEFGYASDTHFFPELILQARDQRLSRWTSAVTPDAALDVRIYARSCVSSFALQIQITVTLKSPCSVEFHAGIMTSSYAQRYGVPTAIFARWGSNPDRL